MDVTVRTFTCDRCGASTESAEPPNDWASVYVVCPPRSEIHMPPDGDVCFSCRCEYADWWRAGVSSQRARLRAYEAAKAAEPKPVDVPPGGFGAALLKSGVK